MSYIDYRELTQADAEAVRNLRHSVLITDPGAFSMSIDEEKHYSIDVLKNVLAIYQSAEDRMIMGAFGSSLAGMIGIERLQGDFTRHKARLWGLYVLKTHRNAGIATALMTHSIGFVKNLDGVEKINLEVTSASTDALRLYNYFGFKIIGSEQNALKSEDNYIHNHNMQLCLPS